LPAIPAELLEQPLRRAVLQLLLDDEAVDEDRVAKRLSCQHGGFSVDNPVRIEAGGAQGRQQLARSMIRAPLSLDKTEYKAEREVIVYRSKLYAPLKRSFARLIPETRLLPLRLAKGRRPSYSFTGSTAKSAHCLGSEVSDGLTKQS